MGGVAGRVLGGVVVVGVALATAACGRDEVVDAGGPYGRQVGRAVPAIERAVGLKFKEPPKVEARSREQVREFLERKFEEDLPVAELAGIEAAYKRLGLLPDTLDLRRFMLDLLTEQIAGYYDPDTKVLYVVSGSPEEMVSVTVTHELVHALQDQYLNLDSIQQLRADNDRRTAAQAVIEGQATYEQLTVMLGGGENIASRLPGGWDRVRDMIREQSSTMPVFATAPLVIQETLIFPYLSGADFVRRFEGAYPDSVPFARLPQSTEQILHQTAYFGATPDTPTRVELPPLTGATVVHHDNLGEFEIRLFLYEHLRDQNAATRGAAGWDGDRYAVVRTPAGEGLVWATVWDSQVDAAEFGDLLAQTVTARFGGTPREPTPQVKQWAVRGRTLVVRGAEVNGRPVVLYADLPAGTSPLLLDPARLRLVE